MTTNIPSNEQVIDSLMRFAQHNPLCPVEQWKPKDEEDFDCPECACGLLKLLDDARALSRRLAAETPAGHIKLPTNADEAATMILTGHSWLHVNAPDRLRHHNHKPVAGCHACVESPQKTEGRHLTQPERDALDRAYEKSITPVAEDTSANVCDIRCFDYPKCECGRGMP